MAKIPTAVKLKLSPSERAFIHLSYAFGRVRDWFACFIFAQHNARVIADFERRMTAVVHEATGGMMSKAYYTLDAILPLIGEHIASQWDDGHAEGRKDAFEEAGVIDPEARRVLKVMMKPRGNDQLTPMLCYEDGEELPGQSSVTIYTASDDFARVSVDFFMVEFANPDAQAMS